MGNARRRTSFDDPNRSEAPFPRDRCVHELFEAQAKLRPDAVALTFGHRSLTYAALDASANRIAGHLESVGVGPEQRVGICLERGPEMVAAVLGVLKSGGAYVPLDPNYPRDRLAFMTEDAGIRLLLTQQHLSPAGTAEGPTVVLVDEIGVGEIDLATITITAGRVTPQNLAYVIYTSGSTGTPKGVCIEHGAVVNHITALIRDYEIGPDDTVLQLPSLSFHPAVRDILGTLSSGARLVLLTDDDARDPLAIMHTMAEQRVTAVLSLLPTLLRALLDDPRTADLPVALRIVLTCGEALRLDDARKATARFGCVVANQFGPTEVVMACAKHTVGPDDTGAMVPAGRPEANARLYVVDHRGRLAPDGEPGELYVGGASVARGYLDRPALTAERFLPDSFSDEPDARMYRTGDMVRVRDDGILEFLGRQDDQIKIRGYRIEPGEIEAVLTTHPLVRAAVTTATSGPDGQPRLVAAVIPEGAFEPLAGNAIREHLRARLPAYMVPQVIVPVCEFPLTPSGKVDRLAVARQVGDAELPTDTREPFANDTERALGAIWSRALGWTDIGRSENFFDLGGDSLTAARTLVTVEEQLGRRLPLTAFFRTDATIAALAALLDGASTRSGPLAAGDTETVMELRPGVTPGLFCVHPDESALIMLRRWLPWLEPDRAVYGLIPSRVGRQFDRASSVEELSESLLASVLAIQSVGPFYLEGYSFGGLFAYELARLLRERGHEVAFLALVDTSVPAVWSRQMTMWMRARWELRRGPRSAARKVADMIVRHGRSALSRLGVVEPDLLPGWFDADGSAVLAARFPPQPHDAPLFVFTASETAERLESKTLGWDGVHQGRLEVVNFAGDHFTIVSGPDCDQLARAVSDRMGGAIERAASAETRPRRAAR
jgi:amino acid adenylation domain-containing protein